MSMSQPAFDFGDEPFDDPSNPTYTVGELAHAINDQLRRGFSDGVWVRGEISGWSKSSVGHIYFDLIERDQISGKLSKLRVAFFVGAQHGPRSRFKRAGLKLQEGLNVRIFGRLDFHSSAGALNLIMTDIDPRFTLGELSLARDDVVRRLVASGLFDANRRHQLSPVPLRVGVVASVGTAAWHDFYHELEHSGFGFRLAVCDTRVQGEWAVGMVSASIRTLTARRDLDCVVVIRGGGARNELATFDAEPIALAIATSPVPILTGLGHEVDRSVADEVAHTALKTPTACAGRLIELVATYSSATEERWTAITAAVRSDLIDTTTRLSDRAHRIARRTHAAVERADGRLDTRVERLRDSPLRQLAAVERHVNRIAARISSRAPQLLVSEERDLDFAVSRLALLDPVNLLSRGWSITRDSHGAIVRSTSDVTHGMIITTQLADGVVTSRIDDPTEN